MNVHFIMVYYVSLIHFYYFTLLKYNCSSTSVYSTFKYKKRLEIGRNQNFIQDQAKIKL